MFNTDRELNTRVTKLECRWKCSCDTAFWQFSIQASVWGAILVKKTYTNIYSQCVGCRYCCHGESNNNAMRNIILEYDISIYDALNCHSDIKPRLNRFVYGFKIHSTSTTGEHLHHILIAMSKWKAVRTLNGNNTHWLCFKNVFSVYFWRMWHPKLLLVIALFCTYRTLLTEFLHKAWGGALTMKDFHSTPNINFAV